MAKKRPEREIFKKEYAERLKELREALHASKQEFADIMDLAFHNYAKQEDGMSVPRIDTLARLLRRYPHINARWLITGEGSMFLKEREEGGYYPIKFYRNANLSAGHGNLPAELPPEPLYISEALCRGYFRVSPKGLILFPVIGNSMEPTIPEGAIALVKKYEYEPQIFEGAIYALRYEGELYVKRIQRTKKANCVEWRLISDNKNYNPIVVVINEQSQIDFELIGRVIGYFLKSK